MKAPAEAEYATIKRGNSWEVQKWCGHHGHIITIYTVRIRKDKNGIKFSCDCPAPHDLTCKHVKMVINRIRETGD